MAVLREFNFLSQERWDIPHARALESAIKADFDTIAGRVQSGGKALVIRGFTLTNYGTGTAATSIQLNTADSILYNLNASESGTFLWVPANRAAETLNPATNSRVIGSFTPNQTNYVGLDLIKQPDTSTSDLAKFLDANSLLEDGKTVPLGRTLDYQIVISTTPFSAAPNLVPVAVVVTDSLNNISSTPVKDARNIMWRLGSGGEFPNSANTFQWPQGRVENQVSPTAFQGGDKGIQSMKDWMNATMTRLWEIGGGENWYSPTADRNVSLARLPGAVFVSTGDNFEFVGGNLHWQGLRIIFDNSNDANVYYNLITDHLGNTPGLTDLVAGQCLYVDIDRTTNATVVAAKATTQTLGVPTTPGSRFIIAWCNTDGSITVRDSPFPVNTVVQPATTVAIGGVRLSYAAGTPATPTLPPLDSNNTITIGGVGYTIVGNNNALVLTGGGTAAGLSSTGGATSGAGAKLVGGAPNGIGLYALGLGFAGPANPTASGHGLVSQAGSTANAWGIVGMGSGATSIATNALVASGGNIGIVGVGGTDGDGTQGYGVGILRFGVYGQGSTSTAGNHQGGRGTVGQGGNGFGVDQAGGTGAYGKGGTATGAGQDGAGGGFIGGGANGVGLVAAGLGIGYGAFGQGGDSGDGATNGVGVVGNGGTGGVGVRAVPGAGITTAIRSEGDIAFVESNPAKTTGYTNTLTQANVIKAWGNITPNNLNEIDPAAITQLNDGFNIHAVSDNQTDANTVIITFKNPMQDGNYSVSLMPISSSPVSMIVTAQTNALFKVRFFNVSGGVFSFLAFGVYDGTPFGFTVVGKQ